MTGSRTPRERVVAVVQARMGSSRFRGKAMADLAGSPLIEWVLDRVLRARRLDAVVLATSVDPANDVLAALAASMGVTVVRGDEADVLSRVRQAMVVASADWVVRVCADNPFIDPGEIDRLVTCTLDVSPDYAFNHLDRLSNHYADGFGAEMISRPILEEISGRAVEPSHREHVTSYIWDHQDRYRILAVEAPADLAFPHLHFDVDTPADIERLRALAKQVGRRGRAAEFVALARAQR